MTAGEVNTIARRFLPTMGVKPTVSKERNKAAVTDFTKVSPMAAAAEFGVTLTFANGGRSTHSWSLAEATRTGTIARI
jgi:hypothetical protein